jgi:pyruvate dehydrogenase (quinone)
MSDKQNVWESMLGILDQCANDQIFGVFGDAINPLANALRQQKKKRFEWIGVRHEEVAAFAAAAQAKYNGKLGVCAGTVGPGAIHLLNGLYDAKMDRAPVIALTGQIPRPEIGTGYHQEVNLDRLFDDVCEYNQTVNLPEQMPRLGLLAVQTALARKGVAHLSFPTDVGPLTEITPSLDHPVFQSDSAIVPGKKHLEKVAELLNSSKKVTLMIGWGARGATDEVIAVAEKLNAPIVFALRGKAIIPENHPHWCGGIGMLGSPCGMHALRKSDTVLMLGTDFPYRQFYPKGNTIIQVDIAAERLGKRCAITEGLVGHVQPTLTELLPLLEQKTDRAHLDVAQKERDKWHATLKKRYSRQSKGRLHPQTLAHSICSHANDSAMFTTDTGETMVWAARHIEMKGNREFICCYNHASMANAMAQAIGLQALDKTRQVVAMCGDGGFSMLMSDFMTAVNYQLPIKVFVFNNGALGLVRMEMEACGFPEWGVRLNNPSFADCAKAMGGEGIRVESQDQLDAAVKRAFEIDGPVVVDVLTSPDELIIPPEIEVAKVWNYSISKMKELWSEKE